MSPIDTAYPWQQMTLFDTDRMELTICLSAIAPADALAMNVQLRSGLGRTLEGAATFGASLSNEDEEDVVAEIHRWLRGMLDLLAPFR